MGGCDKRFIRIHWVNDQTGLFVWGCGVFHCKWINAIETETLLRDDIIILPHNTMKDALPVIN